MARSIAAGLDGERVHARRLALGLTQADLSTRSGLSQEAISRIENGHIRGLLQSTQDALATALGTSVPWLRGEADDDAEGSSAPAATAPADDDGVASDPWMLPVSLAFDAKRHHLLVDASRTLDLLRATDPRAVGRLDRGRVARAWLDAVATLRREGLGVSAENVALRIFAKS